MKTVECRPTYCLEKVNHGYWYEWKAIGYGEIKQKSLLMEIIDLIFN